MEYSGGTSQAPLNEGVSSASVHHVTENGQTLRQWVGQRIRSLRVQHGQTQDDLARSARDHGFTWSRGKVAELERGEKALPAEELVLLPLILARAGCGTPSLGDLIPDGPGHVVLGPRTTVPAAVLGQLVRGDTDHVEIMSLDTPETRAVREFRDSVEATELIKEAHARLQRLEALTPVLTASQESQAERDAGQDAERLAARRFGIPPRELAIAALVTWGRGLTEERDARVSELVRDRDPRSVHAVRGHVTRELYRELSPAIDRWRAAADKQREEN